GTRVRLLCEMNKQVDEARLVDAEGNAETLEPQESDDGHLYALDFDLRDTHRWKLELVDAQGRKNKVPAEFLVQALPNQIPQLKPLWPRGDTTVSPIEELDLQASVQDDFGVVRTGLSFRLADRPEETFELAADMPGEEVHTVAYQLAMEQLDASPDQLLLYYFWAEDFGPDGSERRVAGDLYFADVRAFEEQFRQG